MARRGSRTAWPTLAWLGTFFVIGAFAIRGLAWWPLGAVAAIAGVLITSRRGSDGQPVEMQGTPLLRRLDAVIAGVIVVAGVALLPVWRPTDPALQAPQGVIGMAPPGITATIRELARPGDRLFQPQPWGSWFEWEFPDLPVAVDSRIEMFPASVWDAYEGVTAGVEGWQAQLASWGVTIAVVGYDDADLAARLGANGWRQVHHDADGWVFLAPTRT